ncbi:MAG TPA: glucose 1-dehydrogenase [Dehalococcoidia bacterium]|nr:glucose 1-dehydrogenase [Dehalococcoidia bacterium]
MGTLENKVALISGASRGQGEAEARLFAREGASVVLADILDDEGERVAASIEDTGGRATYVHLDVTAEGDWANAVQTAQAQYGSLTTLINNAGILCSAPLEEMPLDEYLRVIQINQVGVLLGIQAAIPALKAAGGGSIVNTSSTAGLEGYAGMAAYVSSKWAVRGLTKVAALELGPYGIRVNSVHPGPIDTPMINPTGADIAAVGLTGSVPLGRVGDAEEVAALMLFLASDASSYCSGAEFKIDGGLTAGRGLS